ncbi:MAG: PD40 domain-containing protein [Deltaproteobacteria bacterium]|nr:PD40 domain-containing protein [Deltaproteobacteria bacterium]
MIELVRAARVVTERQRSIVHAGVARASFPADVWRVSALLAMFLIGCNEGPSRRNPDSMQSALDAGVADLAGAERAPRPPGPSCGDQVIGDGESCDGAELGGRTCATEGFASGTLRCSSTCQLDLSACGRCGDGVVGPGEACDGTELGGKTCATQGFEGGSLSCSSACTLDASKCTFASCGNGKRDGAEFCEGADLGGASCASAGYTGGTLACSANCALDTSRCFKCGDRVKNGTEACDGQDLGGQTCASRGFGGGSLACNADCTFYTAACSTCGDGRRQASEACDGADLGGKGCSDFGFAAGALRCTACALDTSACTASPPVVPPQGLSVVFVSRQIPTTGSPYLAGSKGMPGVGSFSRFQVAAPGRLLIRLADGSLRTLVDGAKPSAATLNLIDANAPDVSYDGTKIVFAGLPAGQYGGGIRQHPGAWRLFVINVDGTGLRQLTHSDRGALDLSQFGSNPGAFTRYDDTDPAWLPDGRVVFSSTRWPAIAQYQDVPTTNLYVVNADGSKLHRITAEKNGADRPLVDPITGKIVFSRWWRNSRNATNSLSTIPFPDLPVGYAQHIGLVAENMLDRFGGVPDLSRNAWQLVTIRPDGTELAQWGGVSGVGYAAFENHGYGGGFSASGVLYANFVPLHHLADQSGFGGIRRYERGPHGYSHVIGVSNDGELVTQSPPSYNVYKGNYAADPSFLPDGRMVLSWAKDTGQDYGLYIANADGSNLQPYYDVPGTGELRPRVVQPRPLPPVIVDGVTGVASALPPKASGPYDLDGTFVFDALNVYFNAPVDVEIAHAIPVGSAGTIRFFIDHQRTSLSSGNHLDWPILLEERVVSAGGAVQANAPANVPLFEQLRTPSGQGYKVPISAGRYGGAGDPVPAAHVAGHNWGRPGARARCVGCHVGHTMIAVPATDEEARWTNLAPGAAPSSSSRHAAVPNDHGLNDRRVRTGRGGDARHWYSAAGQTQGQWVELSFPVPVTVRRVRLYGPPTGAGRTVVVSAATVVVSSAGQELARGAAGPVAVAGTDVLFSDVKARTVRVFLDKVSGTFNGVAVAGLGEVEVIARGEAP